MGDVDEINDVETVDDDVLMDSEDDIVDDECK